MGNFEPRQGTPTPFVTITGRLADTVTAGDGVASDASGTWARADGTDTLMIGVSAADGVVGDDVSIYTQGIFRTLNGTGAAAIVVGEAVQMKDHIEVDSAGTGDRTLVCVGPAASNADNATVDVYLSMNSPLAL